VAVAAHCQALVVVVADRQCAVASVAVAVHCQALVVAAADRWLVAASKGVLRGRRVLVADEVAKKRQWQAAAQKGSTRWEDLKGGTGRHWLPCRHRGRRPNL
jgi:hypothetical protein